MKTNFLSRNILPRGSGKLLKLGLMFMVLIGFGLSSYAQTPSDLGQQQHLYLKLHNDDPTIQDHIKVKPASDDVAKPFSYSYYCYANSEEATLRLFEGSDIVAPDDGVSFHAQLTLMDNVPSLFIRFGVSIGDFKRTYSLNSYHSDPVFNNIPRLYYDKGHIEVSQGGIIDIYYDGESYQMTYDGNPLECTTGTFSGLREAFVSTYGRLNTGGEVNFMLEPYGGTVSGECLTGCEPDIVREFPIPPVCDIVTVDCITDNKLETDIAQGYIDAYPNPANHQITVNINPVSDEAITINIIDAIGRTVQHRLETVLEGNDNIFHFDVSQLTGGIYYIKIDSEYRFEAQKITIIK